MEPGLLSAVKRIYEVLESLKYSPVIVGTYALIIQGWLPVDYVYETKDIDIYVPDPMIVFDRRVEDKLEAIGFPIGRSEAGGFYADAGKPIEILYPVFDIYIPERLLDHVLKINDMRVLEGHAVLVAKALGSDIDYLADIIHLRKVAIDSTHLEKLVKELTGKVSPEYYEVLVRRIERFIEKYKKLLGTGR